MKTEIEVRRYDVINVVDCGGNLERITCPHCAAEIGTRWWAGLLEERAESGFDDLTASLPCCDCPALLTDLVYEWPCGFARFEIEIWNPSRDWFTDAELTAISEALEHPVRQVLAHI